MYQACTEHRTNQFLAEELRVTSGTLLTFSLSDDVFFMTILKLHSHEHFEANYLGRLEIIHFENIVGTRCHSCQHGLTKMRDVFLRRRN